jgi:flagellar L-ring protein precursor FlgH
VMLGSFSAQGESLFKEGADPYTARRSFKGGDIITVLVTENFSSQRQSETSINKNGSVGVGGAFNAAGLGNMPGVDLAASGKWGNTAQGKGMSRRSDTLTASMAVVVKQVLAGGVLELEGTRNTQVDGEEQQMTLKGRVRSEDVGWDNTVSSLRVADAKVEIKAGGAAQEGGQIGWLSRLWGWLRLW